MRGDTPVNIAGVVAFPNDEGGARIRFIDSSYNTLFFVPDGGSIVFTPFDGDRELLPCRYLDDYHAIIGGRTFHICEFAESAERRGAVYAPEHPREGDILDTYYDKLTDEIALLLDAACGHALVLFTSYAAMSAVKERLTTKDLLWPLFTLGRNAVHTTEQFKASPGSVLLATGAAWEGFDFPGDCVSLLVIPRLPFARPDALKEKEREDFPSLHAFIRAIVVPEMQIKLKQGFGRAIRTETDSCVVAILDERSTPGQRYYEDVKTALPDMRITDSLQEVEAFIRSVKGPDYFREGGEC